MEACVHSVLGPHLAQTHILTHIQTLRTATVWEFVLWVLLCVEGTVSSVVSILCPAQAFCHLLCKLPRAPAGVPLALRCPLWEGSVCDGGAKPWSEAATERHREPLGRWVFSRTVVFIWFSPRSLGSNLSFLVT